jgi:hypothetical protein
MGFVCAVWLAVSGAALAQDQGDALSEENTNPLEVILYRQVPRQFSGGGQVEIVVNISVALPSPITAMGLYEQVPPGWTFAGMRGMTGDPPPISPEPGAMGPFQFAWITPPILPYTFAYTLNVPAEEGGLRVISGQVEYRTDGPRLVSAPAITELNGVDRTPPTITLQGPNLIVVPRGTPYQEPGYSATDNVDGDVTSRVQVSGTVDVSRAGEYTLLYNVTDAAGNQASPVTRVVRVSAQEASGGVTPRPAAGVGGYAPYYGQTTRYNPAQAAQNQPATPAPNAAKANTGQPNPAEMNFPTPPPMPGAEPGGPLNKFAVPKLNPEQKSGDKTEGTDSAGANRIAAQDKRAGTLEDVDPAMPGDVNTAPIAPAPGPGAPIAPVANTSEPVGPPPAALDAAAVDSVPVDSSARPSMGLVARLALTFGPMSAAQRMGFAAAGGVALLLLLVCLVAWKVAYGGKAPRRRKPSPQKTG